MKRYWLVQRLSEAWENNSKEGFDHYFGLEYMGSAEYEFRTPYESLQRMRAKPLIVFRHELETTNGERPIYFVAAKDGLLDKIETFEIWLADPKSKELSHFPENLTGLDWRGAPIDDYYSRTVAWWSFTDDIAWTLDPEVAVTLLTAFGPKK